jgi:hypothetical protein
MVGASVQRSRWSSTRLGRGLRLLIAIVAVDALNERQRHSVAILNVGGMHRHAQQQAERIDEDMALATRDLVAHLEAGSSKAPLFARPWHFGCR